MTKLRTEHLPVSHCRSSGMDPVCYRHILNEDGSKIGNIVHLVTNLGSYPTS